jgi:hypothetical protein
MCKRNGRTDFKRSTTTTNDRPIVKKCCEVVMHKCIKHTRTHKFLRKLFRIKSPSDKWLQAGLIFNKELEKGFNKQPSNKGLERLSKILKEMQRGIHG